MIRAVFLALLLAAPGAVAAEVQISVAGHVQHPLTLSAADLAALPQASVDVGFMTGHGQESGHFAGALLWGVVEQAGFDDPPGGDHHHLRHDVLVTGRDGYAVALSIGELDPEFEGKQVILTGARDGIRLIVPGDRKGGRAVKDVVKIELE
jgi:hypothetical protein